MYFVLKVILEFILFILGNLGIFTFKGTFSLAFRKKKIQFFIQICMDKERKKM